MEWSKDGSHTIPIHPPLHPLAVVYVRIPAIFGLQKVIDPYPISWTIRDLFQYIEGWYNPHRRHLALGYRASLSFEKRHQNWPEMESPKTVRKTVITPI